MQLLVGVQVVQKSVFVDRVFNKCPIIKPASESNYKELPPTTLKPIEPVFGGASRFAQSSGMSSGKAL